MLELYWHQAHIQTPKLHFHRKTKASALPTPSSHPDTKALFLQTTMSLAWWRPLRDHHPPPPTHIICWMQFPLMHSVLDSFFLRKVLSFFAQASFSLLLSSCARFIPFLHGSFILCASLLFSAVFLGSQLQSVAPCQISSFSVVQKWPYSFHAVCIQVQISRKPNQNITMNSDGNNFIIKNKNQEREMLQYAPSLAHAHKIAINR